MVEKAKHKIASKAFPKIGRSHEVSFRDSLDVPFEYIISYDKEKVAHLPELFECLYYGVIPKNPITSKPAFPISGCAIRSIP